MEIRPYTQADWPRIAAVHDAARPMELHLAGLDGAFLPLSVAAQREGLFDYTILVALKPEVVGFVAFTPEELACGPRLPPPGHWQGSGPGSPGPDGTKTPDRGGTGRKPPRPVPIPQSGL